MRTRIAVFIATALTTSYCLGVTFRTAQPVWPVSREKEMNLSVGFRAAFQPPTDRKVVLRVTASCLYRAWLNGQFVGHGPARGPHGWFRIDEWDLTDRLADGTNLIAIEVAGYNVNSYYLLDQPSFLQAEVLAGEDVLAATADQSSPFEATVLNGRLQKIERFSFQRTFSEMYRLEAGYDRWRRDVGAPIQRTECAIQPPVKYLPRRVPYPTFACKPASWHVASGDLRTGVKVKKLWKNRSLTKIGPDFKGYKQDELEAIPSTELQTVGNASRTELNRPTGDTLKLTHRQYHILDFGRNLTGFLGATITCKQKARLFFTFDEILTDGDVSFKRNHCANIIAYELEPGSYNVESIEPYTMRYLKCMLLEGDCDIANVYLREYVNPDVWQAQFAASDNRLNRLFAAARATFAQNAVDIFMDCPSRERAGWLCDSYFTSHVAQDLCTDLSVEKNFLENFLLPKQFAHLPDGMLPMCYPADHYNGNFIPNWALWFVVQLEEYLARSNDKALVEALRPRVLKLFDYFKPFQNEDGLLEKLQGWIFVEWSKAAQFVQDVNYPTNMLYAGALAAAGRLYDRPDLLKQAEAVRDTIRKQSFDGQFFVDNAVRQDGQLIRTDNRSEVCQYYAFFFNVATPETHETLWRTLRDEFGPHRKKTHAYPEIHPANQFIGNVLRLELLSRDGLCQQLLNESVDYHLYMADRTGTLWEHDGPSASCDHGFASHIAHVLYRDVLGLYRVDNPNRTVYLRFTNADLDWCQGRVITPDGSVSLQWWKEGEGLTYRIEVPNGYRVKVSNLSQKHLTRRP